MTISNDEWIEGYFHCTISKGEIRPGNDRDVVWNVETLKSGYVVHMVCPHCSVINDVTELVQGAYAVEDECIVCVDCKEHSFVTFRGWKELKGAPAFPYKYTACPNSKCGYELQRVFGNSSIWNCRSCLQKWIEEDGQLIKLKKK